MPSLPFTPGAAVSLALADATVTGGQSLRHCVLVQRGWWIVSGSNSYTATPRELTVIPSVLAACLGFVAFVTLTFLATPSVNEFANAIPETANTVKPATIARTNPADSGR